MPKAAKTVTGKQHRVKRLEGPAAPAAETKAGVKKTARAENAVVKADKPDKVRPLASTTVNQACHPFCLRAL